MMRYVVVLILVLSSHARATDEGQERLEKCHALLAEFKFPPSAQSRVNMALEQLRLAIALATNPALVPPTTEQPPLGREAFLQHLLDVRKSQLEIRRKAQLLVNLKQRFVPLVSDVESAMGIQETYGHEAVPAILVYTLNVLDGRYGTDEKKRLLDTLEAADGITSSGTYQKNYSMPQELKDRLYEATKREIGERQGVRFLHASILFAANRLKEKN